MSNNFSQSGEFIKGDILYLTRIDEVAVLKLNHIDPQLKNVGGIVYFAVPNSQEIREILKKFRQDDSELKKYALCLRALRGRMFELKAAQGI